MKNFYLLILIFTGVFTSGCTTSSPFLIIDPDIQTSAKVHYVNKPASFSITDERQHTELLTITQDNAVIEKQSTQAPMTEIIATSLTREFEKQGIALTENANTAINIKIDDALIDVQQTTFSYEATTTITLRLIIESSSQTLTQTFNNTSKTKGPLKADIVMLETNFNRQLNKVITEAVNNEEIITFIRKQ